MAEDLRKGVVAEETSQDLNSAIQRYQAVVAQFDEERKGLKLDLEDKDSKIKKFREQELKLLKEHKQLEEDKQNFELDKERELKEAKQAIEKN